MNLGNDNDFRTPRLFLVISIILLLFSLFLPVVGIPSIASYTLSELIAIFPDYALSLSQVIIVLSACILSLSTYRINSKFGKVSIFIGLLLCIIPIYQIRLSKISINTEAGSSITEYAIGFYLIVISVLLVIISIISLQTGFDLFDRSNQNASLSSNHRYNAYSDLSLNNSEIRKNFIFCGDCGTKAPRSDNFCKQCGNRINI